MIISMLDFLNKNEHIAIKHMDLHYNCHHYHTKQEQTRITEEARELAEYMLTKEELEVKINKYFDDITIE